MAEVSVPWCCSDWKDTDIGEGGIGYKVDGGRCYVNVDTKRNKFGIEPSDRENIVNQGMKVFRTEDIPEDALADKLNEHVIYELKSLFKDFKDGRNTNVGNLDEIFIEKIRSYRDLYPLMIIYTADGDEAIFCYEVV